MNPLDRAKDVGMKQAIQQIDVREHPIVQALAAMVAHLEHRQAHALARCIEAGDLDLPLQHDLEERHEELLDTAEAVANQDLERYWFEDLADLENPDVARQYIGMAGDEWHHQIRKWYAHYYEHDIVDVPVKDADPEELLHVASMHLENTFDVDVETFVAGVINWEEREALRHLLAGHLESHTEAISRVADRLEDLQDERDRLQERVDELETQLDELDGEQEQRNNG